MTGHELGVNYGNFIRVDDGLLKVRYVERFPFRTRVIPLIFAKSSS